ncbi:chromosome segregation and condensation protein ScpA [Marinithermus hydrothermalis]|uniref:Segregation and condensation protein A n=1 Tax=Marinithermus hydrothermalis (strain DSM 14884 / JCM 11576 / T1) TaxID=869210 RepID=F2NMA7_MARHT|nr:chromosome segregation and condensation protein ScpA [Marinithermus hydrothermalis]AEB11795.1 chromosome segregation and condensation protein ScpA [Marinithermus hydrothermalis DSM 14884]
MIHLSFPGFEGNAFELAEALRRGRIPAAELPILSLIQQALAQLEALDLGAKSAVLPLLAELLEAKLRALLPQTMDPEGDGEESTEAEIAEHVVGLLVELERAVAFLEARSRARRDVLPVRPPPLPADPRLPRLAPERLVRAVRAFRRKAEVLVAPERYGIPEAWRRIARLLAFTPRLVFQRLPFRGWGERAVTFAALLEAFRLGKVHLEQAAPFAELEVERREVELEERLA